MKTKAFRAALPHLTHLCGISLSGHVLWISHAQPGLFLCLSHADEPVHLRRLHGIRDANLLLMPTFQPLHAFLLTLMVNARHLFYGLSMLDKFQNLGWKKPLSDLRAVRRDLFHPLRGPSPRRGDRGWFMFFVTVLNQLYWVAGATLGALLGYLIHFNTTGIEFVMTALFVVMFLNQWEERKDHRPAPDRGWAVPCCVCWSWAVTIFSYRPWA